VLLFTLDKGALANDTPLLFMRENLRLLSDGHLKKALIW